MCAGAVLRALRLEWAWAGATLRTLRLERALRRRDLVLPASVHQHHPSRLLEGQQVLLADESASFVANEWDDRIFARDGRALR